MIKIGIIGIGFMGMTHFEASKSVTGGRVAAIATRNEAKLKGDWSSIQGNFGPRGSAETDLTDVKCYSDYKELLADPEIDLVDICLPVSFHEQVAIEALEAGKHVLVEKPIAVELEAGQRMYDKAQEKGLQFMVAHVLPFFSEFQFLSDAAESGRYGKLKAAHFRRVICPPAWSRDVAELTKLGGAGIDLHIHDNHFIRSVCGMPTHIFSTGHLYEGTIEQVHSNYIFSDSDIAVSAVSGSIAANGFKFGHGYEAFFENATLQFDAGTYGSDWVVNRPLSVITNDDNIELPTFPEESWCGAFTKEIQVAINAIAEGTSAGHLEGVRALDALRMCLTEAKSIETGQIEPVL